MPGARPRADVVVVGAGPAGAATAILLAGAGHAVTLLDRARFPRDKICGEYLSPEASRILDRLGVLKAVEAGARPLRGMRITAPDGTEVVGDYPREGRWRGYRDHALAAPRRHLDAVLVERARDLGVTVRESVRVTDLLTTGRRVVGVEALRRRRGDSGSSARIPGFDGSPSWLTPRASPAIRSVARSSWRRPPTPSSIP